MISNNSNKIVLITKKGLSEAFSVVNSEIPKPKSGEVLVKIDYVAINRADFGFSLGWYLPFEKYPNPCGFEASGTIVEFANDKQSSNSNLKIGDKVSVIYTMDHTKYGTFAEYAVFPIETLIKHNELVSQKEAAATWISYLTAYYGLVENGKIKKGDYVVITAASSASGMAAINLAKLFGAIVIVTSRSDKKKQQLLDYGADHFIAQDTEDFVQRVKEITNGHGFDIVYDSVTGSFVSKLVEAASKGAKLVLYGGMDHSPISFQLGGAISKYLNIKILNCNEYLYQPEYFKKATEFINSNLHTFKSIVGKEFTGIDQIIDSLNYLSESNLFGKILVKIN
ncbi:hypothetical protein DICPUDRAFT_40833 [Dictyostelium purpureum]|uniref:Enoyl reductase (ER) domain-containing protein n=1 Tax=Dictyostelium purpureum TaxID=5786 RepID=F0ZYW1_DICPU|nr:uncharacterized protein DICPUDRAFT_40833 [Dictyostelium purpureum]EGC30873.1 hypothetical protein DICPUDRAFT_40833 [Dictyostelium purpureum]|eukprot:XP_003292610.1 hypothetical protein DICPUDRAFT_40833 [Dictyostelium purpureum]